MWDHVDPSEVVEVDLASGEGSSTYGMSEMDNLIGRPDIDASSMELEVGVSSSVLTREQIFVAKELIRYRVQKRSVSSG